MTTRDIKNENDLLRKRNDELEFDIKEATNRLVRALSERNEAGHREFDTSIQNQNLRDECLALRKTIEELNRATPNAGRVVELEKEVKSLKEQLEFKKSSIEVMNDTIKELKDKLLEYEI
jgi:chromosome segregation ATPase